MWSQKWYVYLISSLVLVSCSSSSKDNDKPEIVYTNLPNIGSDEMKEQIDVNAQLAEAASWSVIP